MVLNCEDSCDHVREMAVILDAILNFSKCSVHWKLRIVQIFR